MKTITCFLLFAAVLVFPSCSMFDNLRIEKRHYGKGFYVNVNDRRDGTHSPATADASEVPAPAGNDDAVKENNAPGEQNSPQPEAATTSSTTASTTPGENNSPGNNASSGSAEHAEEQAAFNPVKKMQQATREAAEKVKARPHEEDVLILVLLIILAIILPPLAVLLKDGLGIHFLLNLIFWLLGFGFIVPGGYIYLGIFGLIAIIHALLVVLEVV